MLILTMWLGISTGNLRQFPQYLHFIDMPFERQKNRVTYLDSHKQLTVEPVPYQISEFSTSTCLVLGVKEESKIVNLLLVHEAIK